MKSDTFYKDISAITSFEDVGRLDHYTPAPKDWSVVITDVGGSTQAIAEGRYKEVNMVGAASVAALLNAAGKLEVPFVFGGDGASFLIPPSLVTKAKVALAATERLSREAFGLTLRVGIVPVSRVKAESGQDVLVSKFQLTPYFNQALFIGGGITIAEKLVKDPSKNEEFLVKDDSPIEPNLAGLTCRWNDIQSLHGETISLLVKASGTHEKAAETYRRLVSKISDYYGESETHHPVTLDNLKLALTGINLDRETRLRAGGKTSLERLWYRFWIALKTFAFYAATQTGISLGDINKERYLELLIATVEYKKFDDVLRLVISGTQEARERLTEYLEAEHTAGNLVYGIHVSDRALMTCLVFERYGRQVHFIDAADGGYTLAARQLKAQIKELEN